MAKIRATIGANRGDVLIEGEDLSDEEIQSALRRRFPSESRYRKELAQLAITYSNGAVARAYRWLASRPRQVDRTTYI